MSRADPERKKEGRWGLGRYEVSFGVISGSINDAILLLIILVLPWVGVLEEWGEGQVLRMVLRMVMALLRLQMSLPFPESAVFPAKCAA